MIVLSEPSLNYEDDPTRHFDFSTFSETTADVVFIACYINHELLSVVSGKPIWCLDLEEPNKFFSKAMLEHNQQVDRRLDRIFSICPYTCDWLNRREGSDRRVPVFFPFPGRSIPDRQAKDFDVIYTGHVWPALREFVEPMLRHRYCLVSRRLGNDLDRHITHHTASYRKKLDLIARSRVAVIHNLLFPSEKHVRQVRQLPEASDNVAFSQLFAPQPPDVPVVPQLKSRLFEAAFCRSLILCARDDWNVVERYFEPESEFVYFRRGELAETLDRVLSNFGRYEEVVENAFRRASAEYTTEMFAKRYLQARQDATTATGTAPANARKGPRTLRWLMRR